MKYSAAVAASAACFSFASAFVLPASFLPDSPPPALPQGLDRAHAGKVFAPNRFAHAHDIEIVAAPVAPEASKGYGMGPFRLSSASVAEVLQRYGIGFRSAHPHPPVIKMDESADFSILPAHPLAGAEEYRHSWSGAHSVEEWLEQVKERHARLAALGYGGVEEMNGSDKYIVVGGPVRGGHGHRFGHGRARSCFIGRLRRSLGNLRPFEAGVLAFTIGAGIGALLRIVLLAFVLIRRSHAHLNAPPNGSARADPAPRTRNVEDGLPAYSEIVDQEKVEQGKERAVGAGIPAAYL